MKIFIVSSEPLNPGNRFSSVFELAQAKALKKTGITPVIIAVRNDFTLNRVVIAIIKKMIGKKYQDAELAGAPLSRLFRKLFEAAGRIFLNRPFPVRQYEMDGVPVFEAQVQYRKHGDNFYCLPLWKRAAKNAFIAGCQKNGYPRIIHAHNRYMFAGAFANDLFRKEKIPYVLTEHSTFYNRDLVNQADIPILIRSIEDCSRFIVVNPNLVKDIENKLGAIRKDALYIPNLFDEGFLKEPPARNPNRSFSFVNIASLTPVKGQQYLLDAFAEVIKSNKDSMLHIAGDGPLLKDLKLQAVSLGISQNVKFHGRVGSEEVISLLDNSDIFVLPSLYETFGVVVIEAMARSKPVVVTRCMGPEIFVNELNGITVPVKDHLSLAAAMIRMIENINFYDGAAIRANALKLFSPDVVAAKLFNVYSTISNSAKS